MSVDGHREAHPVLADLAVIHCFLGAQHIMKPGHAKTSGAQCNAEVLGVPVRHSQKPKQHLRAAEGKLICFRVITTSQQPDPFSDPRPAIHLVFMAGLNCERQAKVFLQEADQPAILGPAPIEPRHDKAPHVLEVGNLDFSYIHAHCPTEVHSEKFVLNTVRQIDPCGHNAKLPS